jgi:hypothetical protein
LVIGDPTYTIEVRVASSELPSHLNFGTGVDAVILSTDNVNINDIGIDGITDLVNGNLILVMDGSTKYNGIYIITSIGETGESPWILARHTVLNTDAAAVFGFNVSVVEGDVSGKTGYYIDTINNLSQIEMGNCNTADPHDLITIDVT